MQYYVQWNNFSDTMLRICSSVRFKILTWRSRWPSNLCIFLTVIISPLMRSAWSVFTEWTVLRETEERRWKENSLHKTQHSTPEAMVKKVTLTLVPQPMETAEKWMPGDREHCKAYGRGNRSRGIGELGVRESGTISERSFTFMLC